MQPLLAAHRADFVRLSLALHLNSALCLIHVEQWGDVVFEASEALKPDKANPKVP